MPWADKIPTIWRPLAHTRLMALPVFHGYFYHLPKDRMTTAEHPDVQIKDQDDIRYMYLSSPWIQGAMSLKAPHELVHDYAQNMMLWLLFNQAPHKIAQFGLGAGTLTRFCQHYFPQAEIEVLEINPKVIQAVHEHFFIPANNTHLRIHEQCAKDFIQQAPARTYDLIQVDAYGSEAVAPAIDGVEFYQHCARALNDRGLLTINLLGSPQIIHEHIHELNQCFEATAWLPENEDGNLIAIAFKKAPEIEFDTLYKRAAQIESRYQLPATSWVKDLEDWMNAAPDD